jgi:phage terminase large subunit-like protein
MAGPSTALLTARRLRDLAALARLAAEGRSLLPHQIPPPGDWYGWLLLAGRGAGKTEACANWIVNHVNGPACMPGPIPHWMAIIGPTLGDAVRSGYEGPSGIRAQDPRAIKVTRDGGTVIHWPNGSEAKLFGAHSEEDTDRLRSGGNTCAVWCEEMAAWRYLEQAYAQMRFGLRTGPHPRWIGSTTPRPRALIKKFAQKTPRNMVVTHATTRDNPHLTPEFLEALLESYAGTSLAAQELEGRIIDQDENALWVREQIEQFRILSDDLPDLSRITVGVDPSGGAGEQGIVVAGKKLWLPPGTDERRVKPLMHGFVLDDRTCHLKPEGWGKKVVRAAVDWEADDIVVEQNYGRDMAIATIRGACEQLGHNIPIRVVNATRGKRVRAEPVSALTANGRWHHVGVFDDLEDQLCTWHDDLDWSPDRLDAMVWDAWHLKLAHTAPAGAGSLGGSAARKKIVTEPR